MCCRLGINGRSFSRSVANLKGAAQVVMGEDLNYAAERREMMPYPVCDQRGWDVGSGPMESMCGVTTERSKDVAGVGTSTTPRR